MCYVFLTPLLSTYPSLRLPPHIPTTVPLFPHHSIPLFIYLSLFLILFLLILLFIFTHIIFFLHFSCLLFSFHCLPLFSYLTLSLSLATSLFPLLSSPSSLPSFFIHFTFFLTLPQLILYPPLIYLFHSFDTISFHSHPRLRLHSSYSSLHLFFPSLIVFLFAATPLPLLLLVPLSTLILPFIFTLIFFLYFISSPTHCIPLFTYAFPFLL